MSRSVFISSTSQDLTEYRQVAYDAIARLDLLWIFGVEAMNAFTEQYQALTRFDFATLPYWDLVAALRPGLQLDEWATTWPALGRDDITAATMRAGQHWFVTHALARL